MDPDCSPETKFALFCFFVFIKLPVTLVYTQKNKAGKKKRRAKSIAYREKIKIFYFRYKLDKMCFFIAKWLIVAKALTFSASKIWSGIK